MIAAFVSVALAVGVPDVANPRARGGWVSDGASIVDPGAEAAIEARLDALHRDLGVEVAVVTVPAVDAATPDAFATELFEAWGIGSAEANNGLLVLVVTGERRMEMKTGYGLEPILPDGWLGGMQAREMVPAFKQGDYAGGLSAGLAAIDQRLRRFPEDARLGTGGPIGLARARTRTMLGALAAAGAGGLVLAGVLALRYRRRQRTCDKCGVYMPMLDEQADDAHLDAGQRAEEALGSVDWQVHQCPSCGDTRTFERRGWFTGYQTCPKCRYRTRTTETTTLTPATQWSTGRIRIVDECRHCNYRDSWTRTTPRIVVVHSHGSSGGSSGGGGGGSFGGGHTGGGGAGSSW